MAMSGRRLALSIALVVAGLALAGFFGLLLGIADCGPGCVARGERLVPVALIALGIGLATTGALLPWLDAWRAAGWGTSVFGVATALGAIWLRTQGSGGFTNWTIGLALCSILLGGAIRARAARA